MTEYGKRKCELLEKKGFDANNMAWWIVEDGECKRTYAYANKKVGSEVKKLTINVTDDIAEINAKYKRLKEVLKGYKEYLKDEFGEDKIGCCDAETSNIMYEVAHIAAEIDMKNAEAHDIEEGMPWSEVIGVFDYDEAEWEWTLRDDI